MTAVLHTAQLRRRRALLAAVPVLAVVAVWATGHAVHLLGWADRSGDGRGLTAAYAVTFALFAWQVVLFLSDRPARVTPRQQLQLDQLRVLVPVPAFNEDPEALQSTVAALLNQSRRPDLIYVVDDGSARDYREVTEWFMRACRQAGVVGRWQRQDNAGKRHAQATALRETIDEYRIDVVWTVDSDARPDRHCLAEALKPLANPETQTVTSVILTENTRDSLLARIMDLIMVSLQLTDRSAQSALGAVLVNSGASAVYRAEIILDNLDAYLGETFAGKPMSISDDSMLCLFGAERGRTVQQPTSLVFTTMPHRFRPHWRQQLRWGRGSFVRSMWRMKYLPMSRPGYWWHLSRWIAFAINTIALLYVLTVAPLVHGAGWQQWAQLLGWSALVQVCFAATTMLRYFSISRSDQSVGYQLGTWLLAPLAVLWSATVLRVCRWWAIATCRNMAWQTRGQVAEQQDPNWLPAERTATRVMTAVPAGPSRRPAGDVAATLVEQRADLRRPLAVTMVEPAAPPAAEDYSRGRHYVETMNTRQYDFAELEQRLAGNARWPG